MCSDEPVKLNKSCCYSPPKKVLVYHPSNSKKGIAIKGTNIRVSIFLYHRWT